MSVFENFLTDSDEKEIVNAILLAEKNTSGEVRVHMEQHTDEDHFEHAQKVFYQINMHKTLLRNGVLIYIAIKDHKFTILGDEGINNVVAEDFWNTTKDKMQRLFREGNFKEAIIVGVTEIGEQLKEFFPYQSDDVDELPNEISKSKA